MSNIVYRNSVSLSDAIEAANQLITELKTTKASNLSNEKTRCWRRSSCHAGALLLRNKINEMGIPMDEIPSSAVALLSFFLV